MASTALLIRVDASPFDVALGLPEDLVPEYEEGLGFEDKLMVVPVEPDCQFLLVRVSYDGESELLAEIYENPYRFSEEKCKVILRARFSGPEDPDEEDEEITR